MAFITECFEPDVAASAKKQGAAENIEGSLLHIYATASTAISLKRIADALTHDPEASALNVRDLLSAIEMNGRRN